MQELECHSTDSPLLDDVGGALVRPRLVVCTLGTHRLHAPVDGAADLC